MNARIYLMFVLANLVYTIGHGIMLEQHIVILVQYVCRSDPFLVSLGQNSRFGVGICEEHMTELRRRQADVRNILEPNRRCTFTNDILGVLDSLQHLYIEGPPGVGKTELIDYFLRGKRYWKAGEPSAFLFGTLNETFEYIWFEDFEMVKYGSHLNNLLSLMDGKEVGYIV